MSKKKKLELTTVYYENEVQRGHISIRTADSEGMYHCAYEQDIEEGVRKVIHYTTIPAKDMLRQVSHTKPKPTFLNLNHLLMRVMRMSW